MDTASLNTSDTRVPAELRALNQFTSILVLSPEGRILRVNNRFCRKSGLDHNALIGRSFASLYKRAKLDLPPADFWPNILAGRRHVFDMPSPFDPKREIWVELHLQPLTDASGKTAEIVCFIRDITKELSEKEYNSNLADALNKSHCMLRLGPDGTIVDANEGWLAMMGYSRDEILGRHHRILLHSRDAATDEYRVFWENLQNAQPQVSEFRRLHKSGRDVWLRATYNPMIDGRGRLTSIVQHAIDVTERKQREQEFEWQAAAIHRSQCVITFDMHGTVLDANDLFLQEMGYERDEIVGHHHRMFVDSAYAHGVEYASFWRLLKEGNHHSGQYKRYAKGGREVWLQASYNPVCDAAGRPIKVIKYATAVTAGKMQEAEHRGQIAAIHRSQCVVSFDLAGNILDANEQFLEIFGYRYAEIRGMHHRLFVTPDEAASERYLAFWKSLSKGEFHSGEFKRVARDGSHVWLRATYNPIFDLEGRPLKVVKYATDVTQDRLRSADFEGQLAAIDKSQGVMTLALDGTILHANSNILDAFGYSLEELKGENHRVLLDPEMRHSQDYQSFWDKLATGEFHSIMDKRIGKNGREVWIQASYNPIFDLDGNPSKIVKFATDVTSNVALAEAFTDAKRQAQHDTTTALPNRVRLASAMNSALANDSIRLVVLYLDIDRFKPLNDTYGHVVGDRVLGEIADRLRRLLAPDQMVARVGGDEFVLIAPDLPDDAIETLCQHLIATVSEPIDHDGASLRVGLSIGVAVSPGDGITPDDLLRHADAALYRSKQNGRNTYSFFSTDLHDRMIAQRDLLDDMRRGLAQDQFILEYQPRFDTRSRTVTSAEALVRWIHPERGKVSPGDFIPAAERSGLIVQLGEWVLNKACETAACWVDVGVSVNVSPVQFRDSDVVEIVRTALSRTGLPPHRLEIEVTEGMLLDNAERARTALLDLKKLGVKLAIDDFGTGYSSLSYLRSFPFDVIKIDRSFIADLENQKGGRSIVQAILGLGRALGLTVTAEGVETNGQLALLTLDNCDEVQGFLLARPLAPERISDMLDKEVSPPPLQIARTPSLVA